MVWVRRRRFGNLVVGSIKTFATGDGSDELYALWLAMDSEGTGGAALVEWAEDAGVRYFSWV